MVPGPLYVIRKLLFHEAALNNLEKKLLFFLLPLSRLAPKCSCKPSSPLPGWSRGPCSDRDEHPCHAGGLAAISQGKAHGIVLSAAFWFQTPIFPSQKRCWGCATCQKLEQRAATTTREGRNPGKERIWRQQRPAGRQ